MIRRSVGVLGVLLAALVGAGVSEAVETETGPRIALTRLNESRSELVTVDQSGSAQHLIADGRGPIDPFAVSPSSWSADGNKLAFVGTTDDAEFHMDIYVQEVDSGGVSLVPGTRSGTHPLLSPDGHTLAFVRFKPGRKGKKQNGTVGSAVWLPDLAGGVVRRITPFRHRVSDVASSFSPDGSTLLLTRTVGNGAPTATAIDLSRGRATTIVKRAADPVYSPDGTRIAFERVPQEIARRDVSTRHFFTDLYVMKADGSAVKRLTKTGKVAELRPSWDPSGQRLAYLEVAEPVGEADLPIFAGGLGEINADGTCRTAIPTTPEPRIVGAVWQPGPGREAGPISC